MKEKVIVQDVISYLAAHRMPISGFALQALMQGAGPDTEVKADNESLDKIRAWKRKENRLYNRIKRWLRWQYFRRLDG